MAARAQKVVLAENAAPGNGDSKEVYGGKYSFMMEGTIGGGNSKLQLQTPNGTWVDVATSTLSANGAIILALPPGQVRVVITTSTAVYAYLVAVPE